MKPNQAQAHERMRTSELLSRRRRVSLAACVLLLLLAVIWMGSALARLRQAMSAVQADLDTLETLTAGGLHPVDPQEALALLRTTHRDLETLHAAGRPFLWMAPYLGWLPGYGPDIQAAPALLEIALGVASAGEKMAGSLSFLLNEADVQEPPGRAVTSLHEAKPQITSALLDIQDAQTARERLKGHELSPRVQRWLDRLDRYLPLLEWGARAALVIPELLGVDEARTYLVLVQNEDELRATGGFISGVIRLTVEGGRVLELEFEDSYAVDDLRQPYPDPPDPLREVMLSGLWLFRDSNWSPDFPTSAQAAIALYALGRDVRADGVVALDQHALVLLIEVLGPLEVEGQPEPITAQNVIQAMRQAWSPAGEIDTEWWQHRKDFMAAVLAAVSRRWSDKMDPDTLRLLGRAALQSLEQKHLLIYLEDADAAALASDLGWDGALRPSAGDYLMVVDANVGFNKANAVIKESIAYTVHLDEMDAPRVTLVVQHRHTIEKRRAPCLHEPRYNLTYEQMMDRCYWDYLRVYAPLEARLIDATAHAISGQELLSGRPSPAQVMVGPPEAGHNVFATLLLVGQAETLETRFEYTLAESILRTRDGDTEYALLVQKQPGTQAIPLRVRILLPPGAQVKDSEPEPALLTSSELAYDLTLEQDRSLRIVLRAPP
ncbi:MAG: DUF4012 domain-containing protein [Anaerolineae bacterium]|nr:DUF4012 domain-containing protein [Anaerolineae bacterium]